MFPAMAFICARHLRPATVATNSTQPWGTDARSRAVAMHAARAWTRGKGVVAGELGGTPGVVGVYESSVLGRKHETINK
jgi:hypothetical protein